MLPHPIVKNTLITLTDFEMEHGALIGAKRQIENVKRGRKHIWGYDGLTAWQNHIEGALGELAVSKYTGIYWNGNLGDLAAHDVGPYEVRTANDHSKRLIIHPEESNEDIFIFVTGIYGEYWLRGWIRGWQGKQPKYWADPTGNRPAYFIPVNDLYAMDLLENKETEI